MRMMTKLTQADESRIQELFIGRSIVSTEGSCLTLDDGTLVYVTANEGCGSCVSGNYFTEQISAHPNIITSVELVREDTGNFGEEVYRIFVYSPGLRTEAATIVGDEGNGYYGFGYHLEVDTRFR